MIRGVRQHETSDRYRPSPNNSLLCPSSPLPVANAVAVPVAPDATKDTHLAAEYRGLKNWNMVLGGYYSILPKGP